MDTQIKMSFVMAFFVVAVLLLFFGGGMATGPMIGGGMMLRVSSEGINWVWIPILLMLSMGGVLLSGWFEK